MDDVLATEEALQLIDERRELVEERLGRIESRLRGVRDARAEWTDEEHDPEGFTTVFEWSQAEGARREHAEELDELDRAESRVRDGDYGTCVRCGARIPAAQLRLRPARTSCVTCAEERR